MVFSYQNKYNNINSLNTFQIKVYQISFIHYLTYNSLIDNKIILSRLILEEET